MSMSAKEVVVGVGDCRVSNDQNIVIATYALGSCLGITAYDAENKIGGMLHAMLPSSKVSGLNRNRRAMFIDTGMEDLLKEMQGAGANLEALEFKIFGGAQVLGADRFFKVGGKNIQAIEAWVSEHNLNVKAMETGGNLNRTIRFQINSGRVKVKMPNQQEFYR